MEVLMKLCHGPLNLIQDLEEGSGSVYKQRIIFFDMKEGPGRGRDTPYLRAIQGNSTFHAIALY